MTLDQLINTDEFMMFISDKLGNDLFINDPDRADRIHEAAEFGCDAFKRHLRKVVFTG